ncbi:hypothetical protein ABZ807_17910 [Micromonospora sp. NPDC047548]|uniref:hypothetical protein n=1 Tax=Micromonospora sp. NPDC047548 TaxID=3155624 RepID=UPI0033F1D893
MIGILSVLSSPFWRRLAISADRADQQLFLDQVGRNSIANDDSANNAPLRNWMVEQRRDHMSAAIGGQHGGRLDLPAAVERERRG